MRLALVLFALTSLLLALAAPASAVPLDRTFGSGGEVAASVFPKPGLAEFALDSASHPDRRIYLLEERYACASVYAPTRCTTTYFVARLRFDGTRDPTYGVGGRVELPPGRGEPRELAVDRQGRPLVLSAVRKRQLTVLRLRGDGTVDSSFGEGGTVSLPCKCDWDAELAVLPGDGGRLLVVTLFGQEARGERKLFVTVTAHRLNGTGRLDRGYGDGGRAVVRVPNSSQPENLIPLDGGGFAFSGDGGYEGGGRWVARVGSRGRLDRGFFLNARRSLRSLGGERIGVVAGLAAARGGGFDLFGSLGPRGFMARLRPDGRVERAFGRRGLKALPRPLSAVAVTRSGPILAIGPRVEKDGWFSETGIYSAWLSREGRVLQPFGRGGRLLRWASPWSETGLQGGDFPLLFDPGYSGLEGCRAYCPPHPSLFRFQPL